MTPILSIKDLSFSYGNRLILSDISFDVKKGDLISVIGPNGAGKTTLFKCILGHLKPQNGEILIDKKPLASLNQKEIAGYISYIPQIHANEFAYTVLDTVLMGTIHGLSVFSLPHKKQYEQAHKALEAVGIEKLCNRNFSELSGGEKQLVLIARALAQESQIMIMDEPASALDYGNQIRIHEKICELSDEGYTILISTHNPRFARKYTKNVIAINEGKIIAHGESKEIINEELINELYKLNSSIKRKGNT